MVSEKMGMKKSERKESKWEFSFIDFIFELFVTLVIFGIVWAVLLSIGFF